MDGYSLNKDLIFYNPGNSGAIFTYPANHHITVKQLLHSQEFLVHETNNTIVYIEDRRAKPRHLYDIPTDFLYKVGRTYRGQNLRQ
ncbi:MAG: hypothetical protein GY834_04910 [Bacteroidetes bacterium]|nr:hypothetical protein [Bacteroidota bacterium]